MGFAVRPIETAPFGRVLEFDPATTWDEGGCAELRAVFDEHHLLLVRDQRMSYDEQLRFASCIGPVLSQPERAYVSNVMPEGILRNVELEWHSDLLFTAKPYHGLSLLAVDVQAGNSYTAFASAVRAARVMPAALRRRLEGRQAVSISESFPGVRSLEQAVVKKAPYAIHPVIGPHPYNGAEMLYADRMHTAEILGMPAEEGAAALNELFEVVYEDANTYQHWWRPGDLIVWDNLALQHARGPLDPTVPRTLQRIRMGELTLEEQIPGYVYAQNNMM